MEKLLTVRMVSEALHRHDNTVYRWIEEGVLPAFQIKHGWFIKERDVLKLLKDGRAGLSDPS